MARMILPGDATIIEVLSTLSKPTEYVRGIVGSMASYQREHGPCVVRIGTTGHGIQPNYRLEPEHSESDDWDVSFGKVMKLAAFNGSSHKPVWDAMDIRGDHWSSGFLNFKEVQSILGSLRGFKGKR